MKDELDLQGKVIPRLMADILNSEDTMEDRVLAVGYAMYLIGSVMNGILDDKGYDNQNYYDDTLRILKDSWSSNDRPKPYIRLVKKD